MSVLAYAAVAWALSATGFSLLTAWRVKRQGTVLIRVPAQVHKLTRCLSVEESRAPKSPEQGHTTATRHAPRPRLSPPSPPRVRATPSVMPSVLLVRPVDALTEVECENLNAPLDYAGNLEHLVVASERPQLIAGIDFIASHPTTPNRKVAHLLAALAARPSSSQVVLAIDADVRVDGALVSALAVAVLQGAALSFAAPEPSPGQGLAARAVRALLVRSHHSFRALDVMSAGPKAVCGKAMGLGPAALALLPHLTDVVGEDLELGARLSSQGESIALVRAPAWVPQRNLSLRAALARFARWLQVLRAHRPVLFPSVPLLFAPTLPLLVFAVVLHSVALWFSFAALLAARVTLAWGLSASHERGEWPWADWLLAEALLLAAFFKASLARRLVWRGRAFELRRGGRMVPS